MTESENQPSRLKITLIASAIVVVVATVVTCSIVTWLAVRSQKSDIAIFPDLPPSSFIPITSISKRNGLNLERRTLDLFDDSGENEQKSFAVEVRNDSNRKPKEDRAKEFGKKSELFRDSYEIFMEMQKKLGFTTDGQIDTETEKEVEAEKKIVKKEVDLKPTKSSASMGHQFFIHPEEAFFLDPSSERPVFDRASSANTKSIMPKKSNEIDFAAPIWNFKNLEAESVEDTSMEGEVGPSDAEDTFNLELPDVMKNFVPLSTKIAKDKRNNTEKDSELYVKTAKSIYEEFSKRRKTPLISKQVKEKVVEEVLETSETTNKNTDSRNLTSAITKSIVGSVSYSPLDLSVETDGLEVVSANDNASLGNSITTVKSVTAVTLKGDGRQATEFKSKSSSSTSTTESTTWLYTQNSKSSIETLSSRRSRPRTTTKPYYTSKSTTSGHMTTFGTKYVIEDIGRRKPLPKSEGPLKDIKVESAGNVRGEMSDEEELAEDYDSEWIPQERHEKTNYPYSDESGYVNPVIHQKGSSSTKKPKKKTSHSWSKSDEELVEQYSELPLLNSFPTSTNGEVQRYEKNSDRYEIIPSVEVVDRYEEPQIRRQGGKGKRKRPTTLRSYVKSGATNLQTQRKVVDYDMEDYEQYRGESTKKRPGGSRQSETDVDIERVFSSYDYNTRKDTKIPKIPNPPFSSMKENIPLNYDYSDRDVYNDGFEDQDDDVSFQKSHSKSELPSHKMDRMGIVSFTSRDAVEVKMKTGYSFGNFKQTDIVDGRIAEKPDIRVLPRAPVSADYLVALHNSNSHSVSLVTQPSSQADTWVPGTLINENRELLRNREFKEERQPEQSYGRANADKTPVIPSLVIHSQEPIYDQSLAPDPPQVMDSVIDKPVTGAKKNGTVIEIMTPEGEVYNYIAKMSEKPAKELENIASNNHRKNSRLSTDALPI